MEIINVTEDNVDYIKKLKIASSLKTKETFVKHIEDFVKDLPFEVSQKIQLDIRVTSYNNTIYANINLEADCYDWIIEQPETSVDLVDYCYMKDVDFLLDELPARITFFLYHNVPTEDLELYRSLGKIHEEVVPESRSETLYCEM